MPALIVYLLKVNVALCLFYMAYRLALRPLTFYYLNRFFLVFGIIFSSAYPFVNISSLFVKHETFSRQLTTIVPDWHKVLPVVQHQAIGIDYWKAPVILFWVGVMLMALRLVAQLISLNRLHKVSKPGNYAGLHYREVNEEINPFSFWQNIYLNPAKHSVNELRSIIQHEQIHVSQWHTLDVILAELSTVFYWFNPGVWLMKQAVKENLEFITDREILRTGIDEKAYQYSLVRIGALKPGATIVNNFNFSTIKKRIMMMNKKRSSKVQVTKYVILLPLVMLLALVFTISKAELSNKNITALVKNILPKGIIKAEPGPVQQPENIQAVISKDTTKPKVAHTDTFKMVYISTDTDINGKRFIVTGDTNAVKQPKVFHIRINDSTDKRMVIMMDKKDRPTRLEVRYAKPAQIDSIKKVDRKDRPVRLQFRYVKPAQIDSVKIVKVEDAVITYGPKVKNDVVMVKVKPGVSVATTTSTSIGYAVASANDRITTGRAYTYAISDNSDDELVYVIDPDNINENDLEQTRKLFKKNGFDLRFHEDHSGSKLTGLSISINSDVRGNSASANYATDDLKKINYIIKIEAGKTTGAVSIMPQKR